MRVGVLAFHGDFAEHLAVLQSMEVNASEVRSLEDLARVDRLIIPGGESTVISKFLESAGVGEEIRKRTLSLKNPMPVYGTCAGAILLAKHVTGKNAPHPLGLIDITVDRNAYGTQMQSFEATLRVKGIEAPVDAAFIRAPIITKITRGVQVLASHKGVPVLVRQGNVLAGTFHPEVRGAKAVHEIFLKM